MHVRDGVGEAEGERESQVESPLSMVPDTGLHLKTLGHNLGQNQESVA